MDIVLLFSICSYVSNSVGCCDYYYFYYLVYWFRSVVLFYLVSLKPMYCCSFSMLLAISLQSDQHVVTFVYWYILVISIFNFPVY